MNNLLAIAWSWSAFFTGNNGETIQGYEILQTVFNTLSTILWVVLAIVGAIGAIYAVYLGVRLARAEDQSKRDEAKKHLITVVVAVGVTIALILFFNTFLPALLSAFEVNKGMQIGSEEMFKPFI